MSNANKQIITLFSQGFSVEEIAEETGYRVEDISLVLQQAPRDVKKEAKAAGKSITEAFQGMLPEVLNRMKFLAITCDDPRVAFNACSYILDQQQGFLGNKGSGVSFNIVQINEHVAKAKNMVSNLAKEHNLQLPMTPVACSPAADSRTANNTVRFPSTRHQSPIEAEITREVEVNEAY